MGACDKGLYMNKRCVVSMALGAVLLASGQSEAQDQPPERLASRK